jgi:hypothetical protein
MSLALTQFMQVGTRSEHQRNPIEAKQSQYKATVTGTLCQSLFVYQGLLQFL